METHLLEAPAIVINVNAIHLFVGIGLKFGEYDLQ